VTFEFVLLYLKLNFSSSKCEIYANLFITESFAESPADDVSTKDTNLGLQTSVSVETCPGMEETDDRESVLKKMYLCEGGNVN
jgi:hypothetical protein